jgi:hypothetical protein
MKERNAGRLDPAGERSDEVDGAECQNRYCRRSGALLSEGDSHLVFQNDKAQSKILAVCKPLVDANYLKNSPLPRQAQFHVMSSQVDRASEHYPEPAQQRHRQHR